MTTYRKLAVRNALSLTVLVAALGSGMAYAATSTDSTTKPEASGTVKKTERVVSDSWITTKVKSELLANTGTKSFKVSVKTMKGVVALDGKLPTQDAIDQVKQVAEKVKGVNSVDTSALTVASK